MSKLLSVSNAKLLKGNAIGWESYGLHLSPYKQNSYGKNMCPSATKECAALCLNMSGRGKFNSVQTSRVRKTDEFIKDPYLFLERLDKELSLIDKKSKVANTKVAVRLNLTSDIPWENMMLYSKNGKNLMDCYPNLTFYDYSKIYSRFKKNLPANYHLTYSYSGENEGECKELLSKGFGVSVVFENTLPKTYWGYKVIDGDISDTRFLDKINFKIPKSKGYIIGLKFKKVKTTLNLKTSKFVV